MKYLFFSLALIIIVIISYYFVNLLVLQPAEFRKYCLNRAVNIYPHRHMDANNLYRKCLINHGMKPESVYINLK